jgi:chondroitin AC lyase
LCAAQALADPDVDHVRDAYVRSIVPTDSQHAQQVTQLAHELANSLRPDGAWEDVDYKTQARSMWPSGKHLDRTLTMARALRLSRESNNGAPDTGLAAAVNKALVWWFEKDLHNPNWWWNEIGVPQLCGEIMLLAQPDLPPEMIHRGIEIMKRSVWTKWTGQNLVWGCGNQVMRGCLENDPSVVDEAFKRMYEEVRVVPPDKEGIQVDQSFHQHGPQLYNGAYGLDFGNDVGRFFACAWGTRFQIPGDKLKIYTDYVLDGQQWMIRGATFDWAAVGREITRPGKAAALRDWSRGPVSPKGGAYSLPQVMQTIAALSVPRRDEFANFAARLRGEQDAPEVTGNRHFWCSDYMVHRRGPWMASVRMFSDRLWNSELVNEEGKKSHHVADGMTLIYRGGDEYRDVFPCWDWDLVPGTTAEQSGNDPEKILPKGIHEKGKTSFVGGASDGTFGVATMDLQRGRLSAKKAWFFFDDSFVALGCDITCDSDNAVATNVNQCLKRGDVSSARGEPDGWDATWHDHVVYLVPQGAKVIHAAGPRTGRWSDIGTGSDEPVTKDVFSLTIAHGEHPRGASYGYIVLPDVPSAAEMPQRSQQAVANLEVISNTPQVQAVRNRALGVTGVIFREPGEAGGVKVDQPCIVLVNARDGKIAIANPKNQPLTVNVTLTKPITRELTFDLPAGPMAGSSVVQRL